MKQLVVTGLVYAMAFLSLRGAALPESAKIDSLLAQGWAKVNARPTPPASDETILRRLCLDIIGRVPTLDEARAFLDSKDPQKRAKLIDALLASDGYAGHMFNFWADLLRVADSAKGPITTEAYGEWLKMALKADMPYDQFVRELITARGGAWDTGAIGFYMRDDNKLDHLAYATQVFLGTQMMCAQCHDHPFDKWTQLDYYGLMGFTMGMEPRGGYYDPFQPRIGIYTGPVDAERRLGKADSAHLRAIIKDVLDPLRYSYVKWDERRLPVLPHDYKYPDAKPGDEIRPKIIFGKPVEQRADEPRVDAFARWMTSPENPRFTTVIANRLWKKVFGQGLLEPVDEMQDDTVASNPALMAHLTRLMIEQRYSVKSYLRALYNTDAYQNEAGRQEIAQGEKSAFTGPALRRMSAEQVWDTLVTLMRGNVDAVPAPENTRVNEYLADVRKLMDTMREKGPAGTLAATKEAADKHAEAKLARREMRRSTDGKAAAAASLESQKERVRAALMDYQSGYEGIFATLVGRETAASIRERFNRSSFENTRRREIPPEAEALSKAEARALVTLTGGGLSNALRASELSSPTRPGHFLRIFGQSDRERVSNSNEDSTVPQSLAQLNGPLFIALTHPGSTLQQQLSRETDKLAALCLALLSRAPTPAERALFEQVQKQRGDNTLNDFTYSLLNSAQFLFIK